MSKRILIILFFALTTPLVVCAQSIDTPKVVNDQNPNYLKSKNKYLKSTTDLNALNKNQQQQAVTPPHKDSSFSTPKAIEKPLSSLEDYRTDLKKAENKHDQSAIGIALSNMASFYASKNDWVTSLDYYQRSLRVYESINNKKAILETVNNIGSIYIKQKNSAKAEEYFTRGLKMATLLGLSDKVKQASNALSKLYASQGNYKNAYEMHQVFKQVTDSLYKEETKRTAEQNRIRYEYTQKHLLDSLQQLQNKKIYQERIEGKQAEVESTKKIVYLISIGLILASLLAFSFYRSYRNTKIANQIIGSQKEEAEEKKWIIEKSLEEKEILLKEIHHRVKNNLQIISSLLNLQANKTENEDLKKIMGEAKNRISAMALIHQKIYQSANLASIDFQDYTEQMVESINAMFNTDKKQIVYEINTNALIIDLDTAIPLGLIINELLTNSYKYAFENKQEGKIKITLERKNEEEIQLRVSDNGIGMLPDFNMNASKSLGLKLVKGLSDQLKGSFTYETNEGAHFFITFKNKIISS